MQTVKSPRRYRTFFPIWRFNLFRIVMSGSKKRYGIGSEFNYKAQESFESHKLPSCTYKADRVFGRGSWERFVS